MGQRPKLFISHAWTEHDLYERFVADIDKKLGSDGWIDLSIPKTQAIDPEAEAQLNSREETIRSEIERLQLKLKTNLPDVSFRFTFGPEGEREVETRGMALRKQDELIAQWHAIQDQRFDDVAEIIASKGVATQMNRFPHLSGAIRKRVSSADWVFILVSEMLLFRKWVSFEFDIASDLGIRTVAIDFGSGSGRHVLLRKLETSSWSDFSQGSFPK